MTNIKYMELPSVDMVTYDKCNEFKSSRFNDGYIVRSYNKKPTSDMMSHKFRDFVKNHWDSQYMYTPSDFIEMFGITRHLSRYYLMELVWEKKLFRVKYLNKTFYGLVDDDWKSRYREFIWIGVEVTD